VALSAVQHHKNDVAIGIVKKNITYQPYKAAINFALARASLAGKQEANARSLYDIGYNMVPSFGEAMGAPLVDPDGLALDALVDRAATEKALGLAERYEQTLSYAKLAASVAENDVQRGKTSLVVDQITQLQNGTGGAPKQSVEDFIKSLNIRDDLNSTSVVSDMAEKYLRSGDKERARAIALYGFRNIDNYPQASGKNTVLLPYASIIARTEPRMTVEAQNKIEAILREVHPNTPGGKGDAATAKTDFVAEGQAAYAEYRRRLALSEVASGQNGTSVVQSTPVVHSVKEIEGQMHKWLEGAIKKYNAEHPNAPETIENFPPDKDMNERSRRSWFKEDNPRPYWIDNARLGGYVPIHIYGSGGGRNLIVPPNIPQPIGPPKGQTYFYMYDSTCRGNFPPFCKY
jgi:hypothetical protein